MRCRSACRCRGGGQSREHGAYARMAGVLALTYMEAGELEKRPRPCLVPKILYKIFQIPHHIESLDVYMEY